MLRSFLTVGGWTMLSRILGLVRDQILAALMGAGPMQDAYQVAVRLPNMFRNLFGEGALNSAFVPLFTSTLTTEGEEQARSFAREALTLLSLWLVLLCILGEIFMPQILSFIAPGFSANGGRLDLGVTLSRITFPYLVLICAAALVSGVLNGLHRFSIAAAAYIMFNVVGIFFILCLTPFMASAAHAAAWGVTASGVVQLGLLLFAAKRAGFSLLPVLPRLTPRVKLLMKRLGPGLIGSGATQINLTINTMIATLLPSGSVSLMYFADRLNQLPLGVLGAAAGTTLLPVLTRHVAEGDETALHAAQNRAIDYVMMLTLPATGGLIMLAAPMMMTLFAHGSFTTHDAKLSSQCLQAFALGLPAFVMVKVLSPAFFSRGDTVTPVRIGFLTMGVNIALNLVLMHPLAHVGPPLASSLSATGNAVILGILLKRREALRIDPVTRARLLVMLISSAVMMLVLAGLTRLLPDFSSLHVIGRILLLGTEIGIGGGVYLGLMHNAGILDTSRITARITRRLSRK
ncbi:murein biosynthesis integral membrane protein MurJ [Acetobacter sp. AN02]|uniref:murein biosynthesis integral membrane protein MurJ n=1 Tax=Acetobacter sp. AN02 TaxID=2894186 RepID=UPI00243417B5|nr:murein biosynthesis integral membrane protein MurJ [Acetobacter sp. AN02]MDG6093682.1 murein biosynthesis integral membrane protein MurJ [Acetobacter sp. AN02]